MKTDITPEEVIRNKEVWEEIQIAIVNAFEFLAMNHTWSFERLMTYVPKTGSPEENEHVRYVQVSNLCKFVRKFLSGVYCEDGSTIGKVWNLPEDYVKQEILSIIMKHDLAVGISYSSARSLVSKSDVRRYGIDDLWLRLFYYRSFP